MMSLLKSVPEGLKPQECEGTKLRELPPVPYMPTKDEVQEEVTKLRNLKIKTTIKKDTTLNYPVWHKNGTCKAFLVHVTVVLDAIKKRGAFKDYEKAQKAYMKAKKAAELVEAGLALLDGTRTGSKENCKKKAPAKAKEALVKAQETKSETKKAEEVTNMTNDTMKAGFKVDHEKAKQVQATAKGAMTAAASQMFAFYLILLCPKSKYSWNKIISKQTESDLFVNLQGVSLEGPRGMSCESFNDCIMFHLLTVFPINPAEQEKYYITNVLKKPQCVKVCQFVRHVEQLNACIAQMPCFYYSPTANASIKPKNVPFMEAEVGSHVLCMCPIQWQDQYDMNKKGMTPMDMRLLLTSLEAIKIICTYEKGKSESYKKSEKSSNKGKKGKKRPGTNSTARVPKKVQFEKNCNLCKKNVGAYTTHNTCDCLRFDKDGKENFDFCANKKGGQNSNPVNQNFAQLTKKIKKLEKELKESGKKGQKRCYEDSDSDSK
jgi:hypothetical protein